MHMMRDRMSNVGAIVICLYVMKNTSSSSSSHVIVMKCLLFRFLYLLGVFFLTIIKKNIQQPTYDSNKKFITSCIFRLKSIPSALYKCLGGFATNQINMTKLESFSVKNTFDQTNFYLDFEGHLEDKKVQIAMEELGFHTQSLDVLGVYEASKFRKN